LKEIEKRIHPLIKQFLFLIFFFFLLALKGF